ALTGIRLLRQVRVTLFPVGEEPHRGAEQRGVLAVAQQARGGGGGGDAGGDGALVDERRAAGLGGADLHGAVLAHVDVVGALARGGRRGRRDRAAVHRDGDGALCATGDDDDAGVEGVGHVGPAADL